jgi:hypothetical protein
MIGWGRFEGWLALGAVATLGCGGKETKPPEAPVQEAPAVVEAPAPQVKLKKTVRPRLVVAIVLDQFPSWALDRYMSVLPEDGAIRGGIERGYWHQKLRIDYAATLTGPGHAALFTGEPPARSGIYGNLEPSALSTAATQWPS